MQTFAANNVLTLAQFDFFLRFKLPLCIVERVYSQFQTDY